LLRENELIGVIVLARQRVELFTEKQIALVTTFADQAVIAIENTRLFDEVQAKTRDLEESLQQQTATADVLKVISRSSVELETVLETLVDTVARLCGADQVYMFHLRHDLWHLVAAWGLSAEAREFFLTHPFTPGRGSTPGRAALERRAVLIPDVLQDPEYTLSEGQKIAGYRTTLGIPLLREDALIGVFGIARTRVEAFTEKEIELATTFADQAVIAIENARLFDELRERQAELRVTFDNMGDGVVMFDAAARLTAWNRNFQEMLDLPDALLAERPSYAEYFRYLVDRGEYSTDLEADLSRANEDPRQELRIERTRPDGRVIEVRRNPVPGGGFVLIYSDITERKRAEQAVRAARDAAETALRDLQAAQDRLVQTEKLASLGQLTAGIAHEIKNPLNFVNNFSALSVELVNEMNDVLELAKLDDKNREELDEIRDLLKGNLEKVVQHGKRADSIVKNMLLHSRSGSGEHRPVEINAVIEESLNLAYHGARAEGKDFNITLERDFDPAAGVADIYPQEITRVLLNLISNGFYAATKRAVAASNGFEPKLKAVTRNLGEKVEIRIRDNGTGIPLEIREKIFNPFFTTKPAGEGTGLGLSMSHDIVAKQHGGTIDVLTEPGSFTEFIIILPRNIPAGAEAGGRDEHLYSRGR
jgi:two-component system, NtrC family, sensor kinase